MTAPVAFIGLGALGFPLAGHIAASGVPVAVYDAVAERAAEWASAHGGRPATSPADAASGAAVLVTCLIGDDSVRDVALGPRGAYDSLAANAVHLDHTTTSARFAREMRVAAEKRGIAFLDAPVAGSPDRAREGRMAVMVGGDADVLDRVRPVLAPYSHRLDHMGAAGAGQLAKMVNQICVAGTVAALAEGIHFAARSGLDPKKVMSVISGGPAQSWWMDNRTASMADGRFDVGGPIRIMNKDFGMILEEARSAGISIPVTAHIADLCAEIHDRGHGDWDFTSLLARLAWDED
jgi:3-hydroxyisobutyrate dehydrogenase